MNFSSRLVIVAITALGLVVPLVNANPAVPPPKYHAVTIAVSAEKSTVNAVNFLDSAAGSAYFDGHSRAFFRDNTSGNTVYLEEIVGVETPFESYALGINNDNVVVGRAFSFVPGDFWIAGFVWNPLTGVATLLPNGNGNVYSQANAINDDGVIVGGNWGSSGAGGAVWYDATLPPVMLEGFEYIEPLDVNSTGEFAGALVNGGTPFAFIGVVGELHALPYFGLSGCGAQALNDSGWVVGSTSFPEDSYQACLWKLDSFATPLGVLAGGWGSYATGVNNHGTIVGTSQMTNPGGVGFVTLADDRGFVWFDSYNGQSNALFNLNDCIGDQPLVITGTHDVNDNGTIAAETNNTHAVLLFRTSNADLNYDGIVNGIDVGILLSEWGAQGQSDLNVDGIVSAPDLAILLSEWGS